MTEKEETKKTPAVKTLMGLTLEEVAEKLQERLPDDAYSQVPHATYLTEIDPAYLRERLTEVFGLCGYGWFYYYETSDLSIESETRTPKGKESYTNYTAIFRVIRFYYRYIEAGEVKLSEPIPSAGSSDNRDPGSAIEGAITSSLSKSAKKLLWQLDVYKGKIIAKPKNGNNGRSSATKPDKSRFQRPPKNETSEAKAKRLEGVRSELTQFKAYAIQSPEEVSYNEYWKVVNLLGVERDVAKDIASSLGNRWADALLQVIRQYGELVGMGA